MLPSLSSGGYCSLDADVACCCCCCWPPSCQPCCLLIVRVQLPKYQKELTEKCSLNQEVVWASRNPPNVPGTRPVQVSTCVSAWSLKIICQSSTDTVSPTPAFLVEESIAHHDAV